MSEHLLDAENWKVEAESVVKDIAKHVKSVTVAEGTDTHVFFNLTTIEGKEFYIELSRYGFRVVGNAHNVQTVDDDDKNQEYFETPYSLLSHISPSFHQSFGNELLRKLSDTLNNR